MFISKTNLENCDGRFFAMRKALAAVNLCVIITHTAKIIEEIMKMRRNKILG